MSQFELPRGCRVIPFNDMTDVILRRLDGGAFEAICSDPYAKRYWAAVFPSSEALLERVARFPNLPAETLENVRRYCFAETREPLRAAVIDGVVDDANILQRLGFLEYVKAS